MEEVFKVILEKPEFVSADALNTKINQFVSDENQKADVSQLVKQASENIDLFFDSLLTAIKTT